MEVGAFAGGLQHPRWLYVLPNGDVLVAETNAPPRPDDGKGIKGWFFRHFQKKAEGAVPSANRITLLRDVDGDGLAEIRTVFLRHLSSPFGMALVGETLYVANTDAVVAFRTALCESEHPRLERSPFRFSSGRDEGENGDRRRSRVCGSGVVYSRRSPSSLSCPARLRPRR
jgi:glucose/arabinose dehydrogenase